MEPATPARPLPVRPLIPDYSGGAEDPLPPPGPEPDDEIDAVVPFPVQAARFSFYAPLLAFVVGSCLHGGMPERFTLIVLETFNVLLIVSGFALGIYALSQVRRQRDRRILLPAILGIAISGTLIAVMASFVARLFR